MVYCIEINIFICSVWELSVPIHYSIKSASKTLFALQSYDTMHLAYLKLKSLIAEGLKSLID